MRQLLQNENDVEGESFIREESPLRRPKSKSGIWVGSA